MADTAPSQERPRKRRRGGRPYSGCSICRLRKIKCDEREGTCLNCERSRRYVCDGYMQQKTSQGTPQQNPLNIPSLNHLVSNRESLGETTVHDKQDGIQVEEPDPDLDKLVRGYGPRSQPDAGRDEGSGGLDVAAWLDQHSLLFDDELTGDVRETRGSTNDDALVFFQNDFSLVDEMLPWTQHLSDLSRVASPFSFRGANVPLQSMLSSAGVVEAHEMIQAPLVEETVVSPGRVAPTGISDDMKRLIHHYQTHVCTLMMPTSDPSNNPWLRLYLPMALEQPGSLARKALLQAILAVAAFNKANLSKDDEPVYRRQASEYYEKAAELLRSAVHEMRQYPHNGVDGKERQALLAAALTMTTIEVFSGGNEGKGYKSLLMGKRIIRLTGGLSWWLAEPSRMILLQIFRCLEIIAFTSGWSDQNEPNQEEEDLEAEDHATTAPNVNALTSESSSPEQQYTLDVTFGVAMKTLKCLSTAIELSNVKADLKSEKTWPEHRVTQLRKLERELFDAFTDPDTFSSDHPFPDAGTAQQGISSYVSQEIKENHVWAFHYSAAIFYRRALCDGGPDVVPPLPKSGKDTVGGVDEHTQHLSGQELVSKALEHLENVDAMSSDIAVANTLWPGFIAAVEAVDMELRHRALIWFARAKRHGIGNISKAKALVLEVWRRVDRQTWVSPERKNVKNELSHVDWREVMREKGMYIMLT